MGKSDCPSIGSIVEPLGDPIHIFFADALDRLLFLRFREYSRQERRFPLGALFAQLVL
jgi:hypothetical protein